MHRLLILFALVIKVSTIDLQQTSSLDDSGNALPWQRTLIAVELKTDLSEIVFLHGGFTNGSLSRCSSDVSVDPCAIPIIHRLPLDDSGDSDTEAYTNWAKGDHFLDFHDSEDGQGISNGILAAGTPTWKLNSKAALDLLNSRDLSVDRLNSTFWVVDLGMDCSSSDGYFEMQINLKPSVSRMYSSRRGYRKPEMVQESNRALPFSKNMDLPRSPKARIPQQHQQTMKADRKTRQTNEQENVSRTEQRFSLENLRPSSNTHIPGKPMEMASIRNRGKSDFVQGVRHRTIKLRGPRNPSCIDDFPYTTSRFVGKCGFANIFSHDTGECEINEL